MKKIGMMVAGILIALIGFGAFTAEAHNVATSESGFGKFIAESHIAITKTGIRVDSRPCNKDSFDRDDLFCVAQYAGPVAVALIDTRRELSLQHRISADLTAAVLRMNRELTGTQKELETAQTYLTATQGALYASEEKVTALQKDLDATKDQKKEALIMALILAAAIALIVITTLWISIRTKQKRETDLVSEASEQHSKLLKDLIQKLEADLAAAKAELAKLSADAGKEIVHQGFSLKVDDEKKGLVVTDTEDPERRALLELKCLGGNSGSKHVHETPSADVIYLKNFRKHLGSTRSGPPPGPSPQVVLLV